MRGMLGVYKRELKSYFNSPIAYIFLVVFLLTASWLFFRGYFLYAQADLRPFFSLLPWMFLFFVPAVSMRLWAEERKQGTAELLLTLPVKDEHIILGKYLAGLTLVSLAVFLEFPLVLLTAYLGDLDSGPVIGGFLGSIFLGGAYLAIGLFLSSMTSNQIVAFILGVVVSFALFIVGESLVLVTAPTALAPLLRNLGLGAHFESIGRGVIDTRDVIYYVSVIAFFLYLNMLSLRERRWA
ncbi:MAG TPA: ABC transporter permease [Candidatus Eisenbacteria bacterium]|nr:ABC transporter permease [Candidatus Eisenbacteria bacterium]